ncbi:histidine kinase [Methylocystis parvus]|jgi:hypothetical protein|uniref:histidine kinase n=1 Tax=Methylocystis parvus TaxID=134 RepID=UPI003C79285C
MTQIKFRLPFQKRGRRRPSRRPDDHADIFKTFVHVLARMHARSATVTEKG